MNRGQERALLAVLGVVLAVLVMVAGFQVLSGGEGTDVAAGGELGPALPNDSGVDADSPLDESESGLPAAPVELLPQDQDQATSPNGATSETPAPSTSTTSAQTTSSTAAPASTTSTPATETSRPSTSTTAAEATTTTSDRTSTTADETSTTDDDDADTTSATEAPTTTDDDDDDDTNTTSTTEAETTSTTADDSTTTTESSNELSAVEKEIIRLTNALRADPAGELRRQKPMPVCVEQDFFQMTVDAETGHPEAVPALIENRQLSLQMARDWSEQMGAADAMTHRSEDSQRAIYSALGVSWTSFGENVAWANGYGESAVAMEFFTGWRESDTGHYCSMLSGRFTHIGVGHHRTVEDKDWGTQNFYST